MDTLTKDRFTPCMKCGKPISEEAIRQRYEALVNQGIVPNMIALCVECRQWKGEK